MFCYAGRVMHDKRRMPSYCVMQHKPWPAACVHSVLLLTLIGLEALRVKLHDVILLRWRIWFALIYARILHPMGAAVALLGIE